jgi:Family of unknown function (DUF6496)
MPAKSAIERAKKDLREGKSPTTAAGEFVREEIEHVRSGKHGVRSPKQAIAIGLNEARRAGVPLPPPAPGTVTDKTRKSAQRALSQGPDHTRADALDSFLTRPRAGAQAGTEKHCIARSSFQSGSHGGPSAQGRLSSQGCIARHDANRESCWFMPLRCHCPLGFSASSSVAESASRV